jgi:hypothetical protein
MPDIQHSIQIAAKPEAVYALVATAKGFTEWWAEDVTESEGRVELGFFKRATIYRLRLTGEDAPARVEWVCESGDEWGGTHIIFRLETRPAGTLVQFTHAGWRTETAYFVSCNTTWGELMFRIKSAAEGKGRGPLFLAGALAY